MTNPTSLAGYGAPAPFGPPSSNEFPDIRGVIGVALRRRWAIACALVLSLTGALIFHGAQPRIYEATALILINSNRDQIIPDEKLVAESSGSDSVAIASEIEILRSHEILATVAKDLNLAAVAEFNWRLGLEPAATVSPLETEATVVGALSRAIRIWRRGQSLVLEIRARSRDAELAAKIANTLAEVYQRSQIEAQINSAERANIWLDDRLETLKEQVAAKDAAVERHRLISNLLSVGGGSLTEQQIQEIQASVLAARADLAEREARRAQLEQLLSSGGPLDSVGSVLGSSTIAQLRAREAENDRRLAELEGRYFEQHPAIASARTEQQRIKEQIETEIDRVSTNVRNEVEVARTRLETLESSLNAVRSQLAGNSTALVRLRELERDAEATRAEYATLLRRSNEVANQRSLQVTDARLVSPAVRPWRPQTVSLARILAIGLVLGVGLAGALCVLLEMLDDGVRDSEDLARRFGRPALTTVPRLRRADLRALPQESRKPADYLLAKPMSPFSEAFRVLRVAILSSSIDKPARTLVITSAMPDEGKSTLAACLARSCAQAGQRVLLVDCDLRRRSVQDTFEISPEVGLLQVLRGEVDWRKALLQDPKTPLRLLPLVEEPFTPVDMFSSEAFGSLVADLRAEFDLIIFDTAPVLATADARLLGQRTDAVVLVARWWKTPGKALLSAAGQLQASGCNILGVVLNQREKAGFGAGQYSEGLYYGPALSKYYQT